MAVLRPKRLFRWIIMTPCVVALLVGLFLYAFPAILLLVPASLLLSPAAVLWCFEMREPMSVEACFADKRLLAVFAVV